MRISHKRLTIWKTFAVLLPIYGHKCWKKSSKIGRPDWNIRASRDSPMPEIIFKIYYCQQLDRLKLAIDQKWPELSNRIGAVFHQDNSRTHTSVVTRHSLWELGWEVLMLPPYSPDLAPSDYHLFLALQNFLSDKKLGSREDCENRLLDVFANKSQDFYERGIVKPPLKWQQIIQQNDVYLTQTGQLEAC
ncbi:histone-lysine N-methyltransferase SETMAR [Trichonephila clavipes]|nr:histone-lysine N-methyltransferase SETMAR [Trichonephila clavipes]